MVTKMAYKYMYTPIQIGPMQVMNRFVMPPMSNNFAIASGELSERSLAYYRERAKGGFGLITIEATVIDKTAKGGPKKHCLFDDSQISALKRTVDACHQYGSKVMVQLQQAGPEGSAKAAGFPLKSASPIQASWNKDIPEYFTREQIYELVEMYGDAAVRAVKAGVDAVEIHCAHGYLISSFLSQQTNKRVDEFGGCFTNRMRIVKLIIDNIRSKTGRSLAVLCRINSCDETPGGITLEDSCLIASYLEELGVDGIDVSRSIHLRDEFMWAPTVIHGGFNAAHVEQIKKSVSIPVITVGRFTDPHLPDLLIGQGKCDMVAFGRQSIADPAMPNKAFGNKDEEITPCIACLQGCVGNMFKGEPICCLTNPMVGYEDKLMKADEIKHIMVVGGGVGGLYAAMLLSKKGHIVELYEATEALGGQMRLAAVPTGKGDITAMVRNYIVLAEKSGVKIFTSTPVTQELVAEKNPDAVILATGAKPLHIGFPGEENAIDAIDVLDGKKQCGRNVLVIGGGMVGCETADFLAERAYNVTIVEAMDEIARDIISEHKIYMMRSFKEHDVKVMTGVKVCELFADGIGSNMGELHGFDSVVMALGARAYNPLEEKLKAMGKNVYVIGDAVKASKALDATAAARDIALAL